MQDDRQEAILQAHQWVKADPVVLDTETTGLNYRAEICEVAVVDLKGQTLFNSLVRPVNPIPWDASRIHGIDNGAVKDAESFSSIWTELSQVLADKLVVIYNADFDTRMIRQSANAANMNLPSNMFGRVATTEWHCVMRLFAKFYGERNNSYGTYRWHKLEVAAGHFGITIPYDQHRARADADLARQVLMEMASST